MAATTYSLQTVRDVIFTTVTTKETDPRQGISSYKNTFETLSQTRDLFKIQAREIILTQKKDSVWPLVNSNLVNPALKGTDYFLQITIPNALRPLEIGDLRKSNVFTIIDLRELYDSNAPQKITFEDFVPIVYRFYDPPPEAFFSDYGSSYTTMDMQFTNAANLDHPILEYANLDIKCHIVGLNFANRD